MVRFVKFPFIDFEWKIIIFPFHFIFCFSFSVFERIFQLQSIRAQRKYEPIKRTTQCFVARIDNADIFLLHLLTVISLRRWHCSQSNCYLIEVQGASTISPVQMYPNTERCSQLLQCRCICKLKQLLLLLVAVVAVVSIYSFSSQSLNHFNQFQYYQSEKWQQANWYTTMSLVTDSNGLKHPYKSNSSFIIIFAVTGNHWRPFP